MIDLSHGHLFSSFFFFWSCYFLFISQRINKIDLYDYFRLEIQIIVSYLQMKIVEVYIGQQITLRNKQECWGNLLMKMIMQQTMNMQVLVIK